MPKTQPVLRSVRILCLILFVCLSGTTWAQSEDAEDAEETLWQAPPRLVFDPDLRVDLNFPNPTPVDQIYSSLGEAFRLNIVLDPGLRTRTIKLRLYDVTALKALEATTRAGGQLYSPWGSNTVMIADNTPENRRKYEHQALRAFRLKHTDLKSVGTALRSLLGLKYVAFDEQTNRIWVRDSLAKLELAQILVDSFDVPRAEFDVDVKWLLLAPVPSLSVGRNPGRIPVAELNEFMDHRNAEVLGTTTVSVMSGEVGHTELAKSLLGADGQATHDLKLHLTVDLHVDEDTENLSLWLKAKTRVNSRAAGSEPESREIASNFHLEKDHAFWMGELGVGNRATSSRSSVETSSPFEVAVIVSARVVQAPAEITLDKRLFWTGTEARMREPGISLGAQPPR